MPQQERNDHTRRDFLKASTGAAAGAMLIPAAGVYAQSSSEVKIGMIGCGGRGSGAADQALSTNKSVGPCKLIAMADAFEDRAKSARENLKNEHGEKVEVPDDHIFTGFDAYKKVLDSGCDVVILATPPGFRPIHFAAAVAAGKHVFMEKPVATDAVGIRSVLETAKIAKQKNLKVSVGLQRHHQAQYIETVKRIQDGMIGDLTLMRVYWNDAGVWVRPRAALAEAKKKAGGGELTEMEYQMRNWYYFNWLCGDHINEQHIHNLDVANWIKKGPPASAMGMGGRQVRTGIDNGEIFDHHAVEYTYADGTKLMSQCRHQPNTWKSVSEHAHGTKGWSDVSAGRITVNGGETWGYKGASKGKEPNPYQVEHDVLFDAIRNNKDQNEAEYGATSTMTSILGRMATYSGQEIKWEDAIKSDLNLQPEAYTWDTLPRSLPDKDGRYRIPMPGDKTYRAF
jgi:myo-inositol 2-dehydrogenase/D-chiro-inositol 1-dehydrogenase